MRGGVTYLLQQLKAFGNDVPKAPATSGGIPPFAETQKYVRNITQSIGLA